MRPSTAFDLWVDLPGQPKRYPILIEPGLLSNLAACLKDHLLPKQKILVITDQTVSQYLHVPQVVATLKLAGYEPYLYTIPEGEGSKTLVMAERIFAFALEIGLSRKDVMIAFGGGVVGDLTGFCAATYFRGVPFIQIPTTLLAQVDSSVGGKVAVNFQQAKNGIGAFYQPIAVVIDPNILSLLPARPLKAGLTEVVKYSLIENTCLQTPNSPPGFFDFLSQHQANLTAVYPQLIRWCCNIKAQVVSQDETESAGIRSYLNLGHTFAHAYEEMTQYQTLLHGEAVSIGIAKAMELSVRLGIFPPEAQAQVLTLCKALDLPLEAPAHLEPLELLRLMHHDKKASNGVIRLILPIHQIGSVCVKDDVPEELLLSVLTA